MPTPVTKTPRPGGRSVSPEVAYLRTSVDSDLVSAAEVVIDRLARSDLGVAQTGVLNYLTERLLAARRPHQPGRPPQAGGTTHPSFGPPVGNRFTPAEFRATPEGDMPEESPPPAHYSDLTDGNSTAEGTTAADGLRQAAEDLFSPVTAGLGRHLAAEASSYLAREMQRRVSKSHPATAQGPSTALIDLLNRGGIDGQPATPAEIRQHVRAAVGAPLDQFEPAFNAWLKRQVTRTYSERQELADLIRFLATTLQVDLHYDGRPCFITTNKGTRIPEGRFAVIEAGTKSSLALKTNPADMEGFTFIPRRQDEGLRGK